MIEVFKTNVHDLPNASLIARAIQAAQPDYALNFDLYDCDRILRVKSAGEIDIALILQVLKTFGFDAEILPDLVMAYSDN